MCRWPQIQLKCSSLSLAHLMGQVDYDRSVWLKLVCNEHVLMIIQQLLTAVQNQQQHQSKTYIGHRYLRIND